MNTQKSAQYAGIVKACFTQLELHAHMSCMVADIFQCLNLLQMASGVCLSSPSVKLCHVIWKHSKNATPLLPPL